MTAVSSTSGTWAARKMVLERPKQGVSRFVIVAIGLAIFGPYVIWNLRTEQIVVYGLAALLLPSILTRFDASRGGILLFPWLMYVLTASLFVLFPVSGGDFAAGSVLAGYDNVVLPLVVLGLIWSTACTDQSDDLMRIFLRAMALLMAANGLIALVSTSVDMAGLMRPFWSVSDALITTAENAASMGRYSGVFNHPAEAGFMYGVGGLAGIFLWRNRPVLLAGILTPMIIGGLVSVSKLFVLGSLPLILLYWWHTQRGSRRVLVVLLASAVTVSVSYSRILEQWSGLPYLLRLFEWEGEDLLRLFSAGRVGADSFAGQVLEAVWDFSPLAGVGAAGWAVPYDSAIVEAMVTGGVIGLALYALVVGNILFVLRRRVTSEYRVFATMIGLLILGGSLGFSPLTGNRCSAAIWVIIALLVLNARGASRSRARVSGGCLDARLHRADGRPGGVQGQDDAVEIADPGHPQLPGVT